MDYQNPNLGIMNNYPSGWDLTKKNNGVSFVSSPYNNLNSCCQVSLTISLYSDYSSVEELAQQAIDNYIDSRVGYHLIDTVGTNIKGNEAYEIVLKPYTLRVEVWKQWKSL